MMCRHCQSKHITRPRGLCWSCYYRPGVRDRYASGAWPAYVGYGLKEPREPSEPTCARPGTPEKVRVMELRAARGEGIFHPLDAE